MSLVMPAVYQFKLSSPVACATIVIFVAFLFWAMHWKTQRRRRTMQEFADTRNLEQIVGHIPKDFPNEMLNEIFSGFFGPYWSFAGNMVGGNREDGYVLAFDIYVRDGRVVIPSTVVARRSLTSYRPRRVPDGYRYRARENWQMVTPRKRYFSSSLLLKPKEIERLWDLLR